MVKKPSVKVISYTALHPDLTFDVDYMPVLAARVSHGQDDKTGKDLEKDLKLMRFLAEHKHMTPFEHVYVTFLVECPLFVRSEWFRHRTQAFNEISFRYTEETVGDVWMPESFRAQATRNKQSSAGDIENQEEATNILSQAYAQSIKAYHRLRELGVAREQARAIIPCGHMTKFYASANMRNWAQFCVLRCAEDAQYEIRVLAEEVDKRLAELYPNSWKVLRENNK